MFQVRELLHEKVAATGPSCMRLCPCLKRSIAEDEDRKGRDFTQSIPTLEATTPPFPFARTAPLPIPSSAYSAMPRAPRASWKSDRLPIPFIQKKNASATLRRRRSAMEEGKKGKDSRPFLVTARPAWKTIAS